MSVHAAARRPPPPPVAASPSLSSSRFEVQDAVDKCRAAFSIALCAHRAMLAAALMISAMGKHFYTLMAAGHVSGRVAFPKAVEKVDYHASSTPDCSSASRRDDDDFFRLYRYFKIEDAARAGAAAFAPSTRQVPCRAAVPIYRADGDELRHKKLLAIFRPCLR